MKSFIPWNCNRPWHVRRRLAGSSLAALCLAPGICGAGAEEFTARRSGEEAGAFVRIGVTQECFYAVALPALARAAAGRAPDAARLFCGTQEVALLCDGSGGFVFFGQGYDGAYSATNVYWLGFGAGGRRVASRSAAPLGGARELTTYRKSVTYDARLLYQDLYRPDDASLDHWFAAALANSQTAEVALATDAVGPGSDASFEAIFYGKSDVPGVNPDHCTRVRLNGGSSADFMYDGQAAATGQASFSAAALLVTNRLEFVQVLQPGVAADYAYLKRCTLAYPRRLRPEGQALVFDGEAGACNYRVGGWPAGAELLVCDVTDPSGPVRLIGFAAAADGQGGLEIMFGDDRAAPGRYAIAPAAGMVSVPTEALQVVRFRNLAATDRQADYIVICPYEFRQPVYRLLERRRRQGLAVAVAPLPDIYNEFNYGVADAAAIRRFLGYARSRWRTPAPRYILLAGTGTYDPRHYLYGAPDIIPAHLGPTAYRWTALDGWYAQVDGVTPAMALGRIPVETADQLNAVVDKIIAFESMAADDPVRLQALLVSDRFDPETGADFKAANETLRRQGLQPHGFRSTAVYLDDTLDTSPIVDTINAGVVIVNYLGHGAVDQWSDDDIFNADSVAALFNSRFPLFVMLTCQNGVFQSPTVKCLAKLLLEPPGHGAVACLASSGLSAYADSTSFGAGVFRALLDGRAARAGDVLAAGYAELNASNPTSTELLLFGLLGDPALVVNGN